MTNTGYEINETPVAVTMLLSGGAIKQETIKVQGGWNKPIWTMRISDTEDLIVDTGWLAAMIKREYVEFSMDNGGYIATDKLKLRVL